MWWSFLARQTKTGQQLLYSLKSAIASRRVVNMVVDLISEIPVKTAF